MAKKKVLFVCATGIATSTVVEEKVIEYCKEHGIEFDFDQRNTQSVQQIGNDFDLIVATGYQRAAHSHGLRRQRGAREDRRRVKGLTRRPAKYHGG